MERVVRLPSTHPVDMNHLWIAYDALLVALGMANLGLLFLARGRKAFLSPFAVFYAAFTAAMFVALSRRYVTFNVGGSHELFAFLSYGLSTCLNYLVLAASVIVFRRMLASETPLIAKLVCVALAGAALLDVSPLSVRFPADGQRYLLGVGHFVATGVYLAAFTYIIWLAVQAARQVTEPRDLVFARGLLVFALVGYVESITGLLSDLRSGADNLGAEGEQFLYSSIPYALFSLLLSAYLLPLIISVPAGTSPDQVKVDALSLSAREQEVLVLLFDGLSNKRIANQLGVSEATVKTHLNKIFRKAGVRSRFELVRQVSR